jgi:glycosyltransferase involved in cell wall biosynthesis
MLAQVDVFSGKAFFWAEAVCKILAVAGKPYILTLHGGNLPTFARKWPRRVRRLLLSAKAVTTPSNYLLEKMAVFRPDIQLLPNPLEVSAYQLRIRHRAQPALVWIRAFHRIYNPILAIKALELLTGEFANVRLVMVGPDKGDGSLQAVQRSLSRLGLLDRVTIQPGVPREYISAWMNKGDIFLNTTQVDNTPVTVMEAMTCGLCVISTNVGGIPYLLQHERDALLVPPDDAHAMAHAVRQVLDSPDLCKWLSVNARRKAEQVDWSVLLPRWERLLTSVVDDRG